MAGNILQTTIIVREIETISTDLSISGSQATSLAVPVNFVTEILLGSSQGRPGPPGMDGQPGTPGGPPGPQGDIGPAGMDGSDGQDGSDGSDGQDGATGPQGIQGIQGVPGNDGADGADGSNGADGQDGATGATGSEGPVGPTGPQGTAGALKLDTQRSESVTFDAVSSVANQANSAALILETAPVTEHGSGPPEHIEGTIGQAALTFLKEGIYGIKWEASVDVTDDRPIPALEVYANADTIGTDPPLASLVTQYLRYNATNVPIYGESTIAIPSDVYIVKFSVTSALRGSNDAFSVDASCKLTIYQLGIKGDAGPQGIDGTHGTDGNDGADGSDGQDGATGPVGPRGNPGAASTVAGPQGIQGIQGNVGPRGNPGPQGEQGIQGETGQDGTNSITHVAGEESVTDDDKIYGVGTASKNSTLWYRKDGIENEIFLRAGRFGTHDVGFRAASGPFIPRSGKFSPLTPPGLARLSSDGSTLELWVTRTNTLWHHGGSIANTVRVYITPLVDGGTETTYNLNISSEEASQQRYHQTFSGNPFASGHRYQIEFQLGGASSRLTIHDGPHPHQLADETELEKVRSDFEIADSTKTDTNLSNVDDDLTDDEITDFKTKLEIDLGSGAEIPKVGRLPAFTDDSPDIVYLTHDYTIGGKSDATITVGGPAGVLIGYSDGSVFNTVFGSIDKRSPLVAIIGVGSLSDYNIERFYSHNENWVAEFTHIEIDGTEYSLGDLLIDRGTYSKRITNFPDSLSAATYTLNFKRADNSWYFTDAVTEISKAGIYEKVDGAYARLTSKGLVHYDGVGSPTEPPTAAAQSYVSDEGKLWVSGDSITFTTTNASITSALFASQYWNNTAGLPSELSNGQISVPSTSGGIWQRRDDQFVSTNWHDAWSYIVTNVDNTAATRNYRDNSVWLGQYTATSQAVAARNERTDDSKTYFYTLFKSPPPHEIRKILTFTAAVTERHDHYFWRGPYVVYEDVIEILNDEGVDSFKAYDSARTYAIGNSVSYTDSSGVTRPYISRTNNNLGNAPDSTSEWFKILLAEFTVGEEETVSDTTPAAKASNFVTFSVNIDIPDHAGTGTITGILFHDDGDYTISGSNISINAGVDVSLMSNGPFTIEGVVFGARQNVNIAEIAVYFMAVNSGVPNTLVFTFDSRRTITDVPAAPDVPADGGTGIVLSQSDTNDYEDITTAFTNAGSIDVTLTQASTVVIIYSASLRLSDSKRAAWRLLRDTTAINEPGLVVEGDGDGFTILPFTRYSIDVNVPAGSYTYTGQVHEWRSADTVQVRGAQLIAMVIG